MAKICNFSFEYSDVVNPDDYVAAGQYNPYNVRGWLFHDHGFTIGVVFADCLQDAFDELADSGKIDSFKVAETEYGEYGMGIDFLGNNGLPYDIENIEFVEFPCPKFSIAKLMS